MEQLRKTLEQLKIPYDDHIIDQFQNYMDSILEWNEKVNLTAITDKDEFIKKHYIDSLACAGCSQIEHAKTIIDIGTGAGFPGIPLAIIYPNKKFLLLDSLNKRLKIIEELASEIGINNVTVLHGRAEEVAQKKEYREQFDFCVSRAVANLAVLSEYCIPFVKVGGYFAAYKTGNAEDEINESLKAIKILGGVIEDRKAVNIDDFDLDHQIVMIRKMNKTLAKYPRKAGTPVKEPLK